MQFHNYYAQIDIQTRETRRELKKEARERGQSTTDIFYAGVQVAMLHGLGDPVAYFSQGEFARHFNTHEAERLWIKDGRPFYNLWPKIIPYLLKVDLAKVPTDQVSLPIEQIAMRFPVIDNPVKVSFKDGLHSGQTFPLRGLFVNYRITPDMRALVVTFQVNQSEDPATTSWTTNSLPLQTGMSIEQAIMAVHSNDGDITDESYRDALRIVVTCCLLSTDLEDELVLPEVLKADQERWEKTHDFRFLDKAKRRGVYGWSIGKSLHSGEGRGPVAPHWRGPCPLAIYYYGPRPGAPRLRFRKGCMVHREQVEKLPTGHDWREDD